MIPQKRRKLNFFSTQTQTWKNKYQRNLHKFPNGFYLQTDYVWEFESFIVRITGFLVIAFFTKIHFWKQYVVLSYTRYIIEGGLQRYLNRLILRLLPISKILCGSQDRNFKIIIITETENHISQFENLVAVIHSLI